MTLFKQSLYWLKAAILIILVSAHSMQGMEKESQVKPPIFTLTPQDLYEWTVLDERSPENITRLALSGKIAKIKGDLVTAVPLLEQAAQYEYVAAIIDLADICRSQNKWLQATKWYVTAFQIHWLNTTTHNPRAKEWLQKLPNHHKSIKKHLKSNGEQKNFSLFIKHIQSTKNDFFSHYPQKRNLASTPSTKRELIPLNLAPDLQHFVDSEKLSALARFIRIYTTNSHEPYLTSREKKSKENWFYRMLINEGSSDEFKEGAGDDYLISYEFKKAIYCFTGIDTPHSLEQLGILFETTVELTRHQVTDFLLLKKMSFPVDIFRTCILFYCQANQLAPNYAKSADYYSRAQTPMAYMKLGNLYEKGRLGVINLIEAAKNYELSKDPQYLYIAGLLYERNEDYQNAVQCYERSQTSEGYESLGMLWHTGKLGEPDIQKAASYYVQSEEPYALQSLIFLCANDQLDNEMSQVVHKTLLKFQHPYKNLILIQLYIREKFCDKIGLRNADGHIAVLLKQLHKDMVTLQPSQQAFISGALELFKGCYDSALLHFSKALVLGEKLVESHLKIATDLKTTQEKIDLEKDLLAQQDSSSDSDKIAPELQHLTLEEAAKEETPLPQYEKKSSEERKKKYQEKMARIRERFGMIPVTSLNEFDETGDIEFSFLTVDVEKIFKTSENEKLKTIIDDITHKPWATEGTGKPEVLKHKYKNHKGCLSRRINEEDRLVYKVIAPKKVLILSCEGHYKK
ncbi:MAG: type II toxin-antitoxin system YoeB family toxin [Candidatus Paracaedibacter sp.]